MGEKKAKPIYCVQFLDGLPDSDSTPEHWDDLSKTDSASKAEAQGKLEAMRRRGEMKGIRLRVRAVQTSEKAGEMTP